MSADNGVYILKTGRQYRVSEQQCIENLYWDESKQSTCDEMQPQAIIKMFGGCKHTMSASKAFYIAEKILEELPIYEYGICLLDAKMSWKEIIESAKGERYHGTAKK